MNKINLDKKKFNQIANTIFMPELIDRFWREDGDELLLLRNDEQCKVIKCKFCNSSSSFLTIDRFYCPNCSANMNCLQFLMVWHKMDLATAVIYLEGLSGENVLWPSIEDYKQTDLNSAPEGLKQRYQEIIKSIEAMEC